MDYVLIINTCLEQGYVSLLTKDTSFDVVLPKGKNTLESLLPAVESCLQKAGVNIKDVGRFCVCRGAGSFTGIRTGIALVLGLNAHQNRTINTFTTFDLLGTENKGLLLQKAYAGHLYAKENNEYIFIDKSETEKYKQKPIVVFETERAFFEAEGFRIVAAVDVLKAMKIFADAAKGQTEREPLYIVPSQAEKGLAAKLKQVKIEKLTEQNLNAILEIEEDCFTENAFSHASLTEELHKKTNACFGIWFDNALAGFALLSHVADECEIIQIAVRPKDQGKGLAYRLLEYAFQTLQPIRAFLEVNKKNTKAIQLYKRLGFKKAGERKNYYQNGDDALILEKAF